MRVKTYRNLHKQCWSVVAMEGENKGRVIAHPQFLQMKNVEFRVQPAGRVFLNTDGALFALNPRG